MENQTKTMMQLVGLLKSNKKFIGFTTAQKLAMIHDLAVQEMRDSKTVKKRMHHVLFSSLLTLD